MAEMGSPERIYDWAHEEDDSIFGNRALSSIIPPAVLDIDLCGDDILSEEDWTAYHDDVSGLHSMHAPSWDDDLEDDVPIAG